MSDYAAFLRAKAVTVAACGFTVDDADLGAYLYPFQRDVVRWALRLGRAAIFADCGMGKTVQQLEWARHVSAKGPVLILAPLAVATQTVREAERFGISARYLREDDGGGGIIVTNYEMLHHFDASRFTGIVLDESSILKSYDGKTRVQIVDSFHDTPYRLACTATPAPNDFVELGNHSEFLGVMSRVEMLSMFFCHDGGSTQDWRVKGHAEKDFWKWVCGWAVMLRKPSDLGYVDDGFALPPLEMHEHVVAVDHVEARAEGMLFALEAQSLTERRDARRNSLDERIQKCASLVAAHPDESWLLWCNLNAEGDGLAAAIPGAVQVSGSDTAEHKEQAMLDFVAGRVRVLISKPSICGFGMNFQHCANVAFVGLSDSYEQFYQATRRCWRFGQTRPVNCHLITAETEGAVVANVQRKEADVQRMVAGMLDHMREEMRANIRATKRQSVGYQPAKAMRVPSWMRSEAA